MSRRSRAPLQVEVARSTSRRPLLVTGMHRSGTSWLGEMLCAGGQFVNIGEPLNAMNRQTILRGRAERWYTYITRENEDEFLSYYRDAAAFKLHPVHDLRRMRLGSPRDPFRIANRWSSFILARARTRRLLIKDPFASFSIDWFVAALGCDVVAIVRHPVAVASSLKRLGWAFDFNDLLDQPLLMAQRLEPFRPEIEAAAERPNDLIGNAALLWRIVYSAIDESRSRGLVRVVHHEDLSLNPSGEFARLYQVLGLTFTEVAKRKIERATNPGNRSELSRGNPFSVHLDSRANLENWRHRLTPSEVEHVLDVAAAVVGRFYAPGGEDTGLNLLSRGDL